MDKQPAQNACWVTVAHFCLQCLQSAGTGVAAGSLRSLMDEYYRVPTNAGHNAMAGAGHPSVIFRAGSVDFKTVPTADLEQELPARIAAWLADHKPVICGLVSDNLTGWGHMVVIVGATGNGARFAFKNPARPNVLDTVTPDELFVSGFVYDTRFEHRDEHGYPAGKPKHIYVYCSQVIFVGDAG